MKIINNPRTDHIQKKNAFAADVLRELLPVLELRDHFEQAVFAVTLL